MYLVGITGPSGSGKTTLAQKLMQKLHCRTLHLTQDMYYRDTPGLTDAQRRQINYDAPQSFDFALLYGDLSQLAQGCPIERREYDYVQYRRKDTGQAVGPAPVVILEGIHIFYRQEIAARCDLKIFVQLDADLCLLRRLRRDVAQRGRTLDSVARQYEATVKPMYEKYVRNYAPLADLVVPTVRENDLAVEILAQHINRAAAPEACLACPRP